EDGLHALVGQHREVLISVGEDDDLKFAGTLGEFLGVGRLREFGHPRGAGQALVKPGSVPVSMGEPARSGVELYSASLLHLGSHWFTFASHSASRAARCLLTAFFSARSTFPLGVSPHSCSNISSSPSANLTLISHSPSFFA